VKFLAYSALFLLTDIKDFTFQPDTTLDFLIKFLVCNGEFPGSFIHELFKVLPVFSQVVFRFFFAA